MGLWDDFTDTVSDAADAVADVAEDVADGAAAVVNAVGEVVSDAAETVGNAVEDGANAVGGWLADAASNIPGVGEGLATGIRAVFGWVGAVVSGIFDVVGAAVKAVTGIVAGVVQGVIKIIGGIITLRGGLIVDGILDIVSGVLGSLLVLLGKTWALIQAVFHLQAFERPLTREEIALLTRVFKESVAFYNVRIVEGWSGLYGTNERPFTLGNTIYMKDRAVTADLLVHEVTHVWQYQHTGSRYATDAIGAQWFVEDEYSWQVEIDRGNTAWVDMNKEAQAAFIEDIWVFGKRLNASGAVEATGNGAFYDADGKDTFGQFDFGIDHTDRANVAVAVVRGWPAIRISNFWS